MSTLGEVGNMIYKDEVCCEWVISLGHSTTIVITTLSLGSSPVMSRMHTFMTWQVMIPVSGRRSAGQLRSTCVDVPKNTPTKDGPGFLTSICWRSGSMTSNKRMGDSTEVRWNISLECKWAEESTTKLNQALWPHVCVYRYRISLQISPRHRETLHYILYSCVESFCRS